MSNSEFHVYKGNYLSDFGTPTVIISKNTTNKSILTSEYFVFIEGDDNLFWCERRLTETNLAPNDVINSFIDNAIIDTLHIAKTSISLIQNEFYKKNKIKPLSRKEVELVEIDKSNLIGLYRSNNFNNELMSIQKQSNCKELQEYLSALSKVSFT